MPDWFHLVFGKQAIAARLASDKDEKKRVARGIDEIAALLPFLRIFFQSVALRTVVIHE